MFSRETPRKLGRQDLGILVLYFVICCAVTWPLAGNWRTHVFAFGDSMQFVWSFWWVKFSWLDLGQSFFHTEYLFYPEGTSLAFHEFSLLNCFVSIPLQALWGAVPAYNLLSLATFVLGCFNAYWLALDWTGCRKSSFVAGISFGFCAFHTQHTQMLSVSSIQWIPLFVLFFCRFLKEPTWKSCSLAVISYLLNALTCWYYMVYLALWGSVLWIVACVRQIKQGKPGRFFGFSIAFASFSLVLLGPFLWPAIQETLSGETYMKIADDMAHQFSADLAAFFYMPSHHFLTGRYFASLNEELLTHPTEHVVFLGYLSFALALLGAWTAPRARTAAWLWSGLLFLVLSLGPHLQIRGVEYSALRLPYFYLMQLPFLDSMRAPVRFVVLVALCQSTLAAVGCQQLWRWLKRWRWGARAALPLTTLLGAWIIVEQVPRPGNYEMTPMDIERHPLFLMLRRDPTEGALLHLPLADLRFPNPMVYQTVHHRKILGGYVARESAENNRFLFENWILGRLASLRNSTTLWMIGFDGERESKQWRRRPQRSMHQATQLELDPMAASDFFVNEGIRFILIHKACYPKNTLGLLRSQLRQFARRYFEDAAFLVFQVDGFPAGFSRGSSQLKP